MKKHEVLERLRVMLMPVLGLDSIEKIRPGDALVNDLGAESIDFVEIIYLIEKDFGVVLRVDEIAFAGVQLPLEGLFKDGKLTQVAESVLNAHLPDGRGRFRVGMTKIQLFSSLTVDDLAGIIAVKSNEKAEPHA